MTTARRGRAAFALVLICLLTATLLPSAASAEPEPEPKSTGYAPAARAAWGWPLEGARLVSAFLAPAHDYAPGHRGIDVVSPSGATSVRAPDDGVVAFAGVVADRGVVTIDHGGGVVSTLEPIRPAVGAGAVVGRGDVIGELSVGGHADPGSLHLGARVDGAYVNPLAFLGGVPRAVLLPCC